MKTVDIITRDMHQLHGANRVTEKLIFGSTVFQQNGIILENVISNDGITICEGYSSQLGIDSLTEAYQRNRKKIERLKEIPLYKTSIVQGVILNKGYLSNSKANLYFNQLKVRPDLVIFQDPFTAIYVLKHQKNIPKSIFITHTDRDPFDTLLIDRPSIKGTFIEKKLREDYEFLIRGVDKVVTICSSSQIYMKETYGMTCPCIINGIEDYKCKVEKYSVRDKKVHIVIVGSVQHRKGQDTMIYALNSLNEDERQKIHLHIVGIGVLLETLKLEVKKLELEKYVTFHGSVLDVENLLLKMDAFILPSLSDTVPMAIIEALRAGLPVWSTNVGEVPNMISGCGGIIQANVESVKHLLREIIIGKHNLEEISVKSRKKFLDEFEISIMIKKYAEVINDLVN